MTGKEPNPTCFFCSQSVGDDTYCYGCEEYLCEACDTTTGGVAGYGHMPEDHQEEKENAFGTQ